MDNINDEIGKLSGPDVNWDNVCVDAECASDELDELRKFADEMSRK